MRLGRQFLYLTPPLWTAAIVQATLRLDAVRSLWLNQASVGHLFMWGKEGFLAISVGVVYNDERGCLLRRSRKGPL